MLKPCIRESVPEHKIEIHELVSKILQELPVHFKGSLVNHRKRKKLTREQLEVFSGGVSVSTIRRLETDINQEPKMETIIALCIGMKLYPDFSFDLIEKSSEKLNSQIPQHSVYKMILRNKYHLSIHDCNDFLESYNLEKNNLTKKTKKTQKKI